MFTTPGSVPFTHFSSIGDWTYQLSSTRPPSLRSIMSNSTMADLSLIQLKLWRFMLGLSYP